MRGASTEGNSAEVNSCAEIAKKTRLARRQLFRDQAANAAFFPLSKIKKDELGASGRGDRPRPERPEGRAGAARIRDERHFFSYASGFYGLELLADQLVVALFGAKNGVGATLFNVNGVEASLTVLRALGAQGA